MACAQVAGGVESGPDIHLTASFSFVHDLEHMAFMAEHLGGAALEAYEAAMRRVESEGAFNPLEEALSPADHAQAAQARL